MFMEQSFQRTLLQVEAMVEASGTPTAVWRRTGELAGAGPEFWGLTGYNKEDDGGGGDLNKERTRPRFIVEMMDDESVTKYFELFNQLVFGDSRGVIMTECTLLSPKGEKIPTVCTWTVKRDVFDIPMMIIGNFLPILD